MGAKKKMIDPAKVYELAAMGLNKGMICKGLGIGYDTYEIRANDNPLISDALKRGKDFACQQVEDTLYTMAKSGKSVAATIFYLKNAKPDQYKDVHDIKHTGELNITTGFKVIEPPDMKVIN